MARFFCLLSIVSFFMTLPALGSVLGEFYSENTYLEREAVFSNTIRLRESFFSQNAVRPYLQLGQDIQRNVDQGVLSKSSHGYLGAGIATLFGPVQLYLEGRGRAYYERSSLPQTDFRSLFVVGDFSELPLRENSLSLFLEPYSETLFTTADTNNVIFVGYVRGGLRSRLLNPILFDLFAEPYVTLDRVGHTYNNKADFKFTLRTSLNIDSLSVGLQTSYLFTRYFSSTPSGDGFRLLLTAGGSF